MNGRKILFLFCLLSTGLLSIGVVGISAKNKAGADGHRSNLLEGGVGTAGGFLALFVSFYGIIAGVLFRDIHLPSFSVLGSISVFLLAFNSGSIIFSIASGLDNWTLLTLEFALALGASVFFALSIGLCFGAPSSTRHTQEDLDAGDYAGAEDGWNLNLGQDNSSSSRRRKHHDDDDDDDHHHQPRLHVNTHNEPLLATSGLVGEETYDDPEGFRQGTVSHYISASRINWFVYPFIILAIVELLVALSFTAAFTSEIPKSDDEHHFASVLDGLALTGTLIGIIICVCTLVVRFSRLRHRILRPLWVHAVFISLWLLSAAAGLLANELYRPVLPEAFSHCSLFIASFAVICLSSLHWVVGIAIHSFIS